MARILLVDDDTVILNMLSALLKAEDYDVILANNSVKAAELIDTQSFDVMITDYWLTPFTGKDLLQMVLDRKLTTTVLIISGCVEADKILEVLKMGAFDYVNKPFQMDVFLNTVQRALDYHRLVEENADRQLQLVKHKGVPTTSAAAEWDGADVARAEKAATRAEKAAERAKRAAGTLEKAAARAERAAQVWAAVAEEWAKMTEEGAEEKRKAASMAVGAARAWNAACGAWKKVAAGEWEKLATAGEWEKLAERAAKAATERAAKAATGRSAKAAAERAAKAAAERAAKTASEQTAKTASGNAPKPSG